MHHASRIRIGLILPLVAAAVALGPLGSPVSAVGLDPDEVEVQLATQSQPGGSVDAAWTAAFMASQGRAPTDADRLDRIWSMNFVALSGRAPTDADWQLHAYRGAFNENQGPDEDGPGSV